MKRIVTMLVVAGAAALLAPPASADDEICVYGRTPYPLYCVKLPHGS